MAVVSSATYAASRPFSMAQGRNGDIYGVNGLTRGFRWDGTTLQPIGITAAGTISALSVATSQSPALYFVSDCVVVDPGENYVKPPSVSVVGVSGARASISGGGVVGVDFTTSSKTHQVSPFITLVDGQATGGVLAVTAVGGVGAVDLPYGAVGEFTANPPVSFSAYPGVTVLRDAKAFGVVSFGSTGATSGPLTSVVITDPGRYVVPANFDGYARPLAVTMGAAANGQNYAHLLTPRFSGHAATVAISSAGSEYTTPPTIEIFSLGEDAKGSGAVIECAVSEGKISAATIVQPGTGYDGRIGCTVTSRPAQAKANIQPRLNGKYLCGVRYVDSTPASRGGPIAGDMSELVEVDCSPGAQAISWRLPSAPPTDGTPNRIAKLELWRTTADQAITLYKVTEFAIDSIPEFYGDTLTDDELTDSTALVPYFYVGGVTVTNAGSGYTKATVSFTGGSTDFPATATATVASGKIVEVVVDYGGFKYQSMPDVSFTGDGDGAVAVANPSIGYTFASQDLEILPVLTPEGYPNAARFGVPPSQMAVICMFQDRAWYTVDTTGAEPNAIYFSEVDEPESVPQAYQVVIQQVGREPDKITGLIPLDSSLYVCQTRSLHRLTVTGHPLEGAASSPAAQRGLINDRCWDVADGVAYIVDDYGLYAFNGQSVEPLSDPISAYWSESRIDFSKSTWFFVRADVNTNVVRFYYVPNGSNATYPNAALCYSLVTKAWWTEEYADEVACAVTARLSGRQCDTLGGDSVLYKADSGVTDNGTAIPYYMATGNLPLNADERRGLRLTYTPVTSGSLGIRLAYNGSTSPRPFAVDSDNGTGVTTVAGSTEAALDMSQTRSALGDSNGYSQLWLSGRLDDKSAGADRHIAIHLAGQQSSSKVILHRMEIEGAG